MQGCKYSNALKCTECTEVYYTKCKKFITAHAAFLSRNIKPFKFNSSVKVKGDVMWSRDQNKCKSVALKYALKLNSEVKKLSLSQVLSLTMSGSDIEGSIFYIEHTTKSTGDIDKIKGVLTSFIENVTLSGAKVVVFIGQGITGFNLDYNQI